MVIFGTCKSSVVCSTVSQILLKLHTDSSAQSQNFKTALTELGLAWTFVDPDGQCYIEGSWDAILKGHSMLTAVSKASKYPEIFQDLGRLYQWVSNQHDEATSKVVQREELNYTHDALVYNTIASGETSCEQTQPNVVHSAHLEDGTISEKSSVSYVFESKIISISNKAKCHGDKEALPKGQQKVPVATQPELKNCTNQTVLRRAGSVEMNDVELTSVVKQSEIKVAHLISKTTLDSGIYRYKCKKCDYISDGKDANTIRDHIKRNHIDTPQLYPCTKCDKKYKVKKDLNRHVKTHSMSFGCTLCNKQYNYKLSLQRHMKTEHKSAPVFRPLCQSCGKDFVNNTALKYHIERNHMGQLEIFVCETCGKKLLTSSGYKKHINGHADGPKRETHPCHSCGEVLGSKVALQYHVQAKHSEARDFSCHICGKTFKVRTVYNNHMKIHEERIRFKCTICNKSFLNRFSLKNHMLTHTAKRGKYLCCQPGCGKTYSGRKGLKKHLSSQHNINMSPGKSGRPSFQPPSDSSVQNSRDQNFVEKAIVIEKIPGTRTVTGTVREEFIVEDNKVMTKRVKSKLRKNLGEASYSKTGSDKNAPIFGSDQKIRTENEDK